MNEDGYQLEPSVLTDQECDRLIESLGHSSGERGRAGRRNLMTQRTISAVVTDARLLGIACEALGNSAVPFRATLFDKSSYANWVVRWHQDAVLPLASRFDSNEWGPWSMKAGVLFARAPVWALSRVVALRIHLDASTLENGPLRVIPGSHRFGLLSSAGVLKFAREQENVECAVPRGGVLAMRPLLIHSSSRARLNARRRVLHIEYADSLCLADNIQLAAA